MLQTILCRVRSDVVAYTVRLLRDDLRMLYLNVWNAASTLRCSKFRHLNHMRMHFPAGLLEP